MDFKELDEGFTNKSEKILLTFFLQERARESLRLKELARLSSGICQDRDMPAQSDGSGGQVSS